eukprot:scaffold4390_cov71-Skeletonema_dohrnii-CCMP3373.AAC.9
MSDNRSRTTTYLSQRQVQRVRVPAEEPESPSSVEDIEAVSIGESLEPEREDNVVTLVDGGLFALQRFQKRQALPLSRGHYWCVLIQVRQSFHFREQLHDIFLSGRIIEKYLPFPPFQGKRESIVKLLAESCRRSATLESIHKGQVSGLNQGQIVSGVRLSWLLLGVDMFRPTTYSKESSFLDDGFHPLTQSLRRCK